MAIYFRVRDHREVSSSEALDERGLLRHGFGRRVPYSMRDAAPRFSDARAFWDRHRDELVVTDARAVGGVEGCRPGFRVFDSDVGRAAKDSAYAAHEWYLNNAYRDAATAGAYPYSAAALGAPCTINGNRGTLVEQDGVLICKPLSTDAAKPPRDPEEDDGEDEDDDDGEGATSDHRTVTVDAMSANHQRRMQRDFYDAYAREISEAWRKR